MSEALYYSYFQEEPSSFAQSYLFSTPHCAYTIYFDPSAYIDILDGFPYLLNTSYGFGFFNLKHNPATRNVEDRKVSNTIIKIAADFIDSVGEDTVLLFHCDVLDRRQACRHKLFLRWYERSGIYHLDMVTLEVDVVGEKYYIGFITKKTNKYLAQLREEFEILAVRLVNNK